MFRNEMLQKLNLSNNRFSGNGVSQLTAHLIKRGSAIDVSTAPKQKKKDSEDLGSYLRELDLSSCFLEGKSI
jgi:hypothetical protein